MASKTVTTFLNQRVELNPYKMSNKKRLELRQTEKDLLNISAGDLIPMLEKKTKLLHVKQTAFQHYCKKTKEFFHVQVTVTRNPSDFLGDFTTEEMSEYQ
jgi:hypothetical protein